MHYNKVIFDITFGYLRCIEKQVILCKDQEQLNEAMKQIVDEKELMHKIKLASQELVQSDIDFYRPVSHKEVLEDTQEQMTKKMLFN